MYMWLSKKEIWFDLLVAKETNCMRWESLGRSSMITLRGWRNGKEDKKGRVSCPVGPIENLSREIMLFWREDSGKDVFRRGECTEELKILVFSSHSWIQVKRWKPVWQHLFFLVLFPGPWQLVTSIPPWGLSPSSAGASQDWSPSSYASVGTMWRSCPA